METINYDHIYDSNIALFSLLKPFLSVRPFSVQDVLLVEWKMDFVSTTQILLKKRRNKVTLHVTSYLI